MNKLLSILLKLLLLPLIAIPSVLLILFLVHTWQTNEKDAKDTTELMQAAQAKAATPSKTTAQKLVAESPIICEQAYKDVPYATSIWPELYLGKRGELCFNVKSWPEYSGQNCVTNGGSTSWAAFVVVFDGDEPQGRDTTSFRAIKPTVTSDLIQYKVEWSRGDGWKPLQDVSIDRLSGDAVSHMLTEHGAESYKCRVESRKM